MSGDGDLPGRIRELERALAEAEETNRALATGQVDAVVDRSGGALLLHEAQSALRQSEERYRTIVTTAEEGIWTVDPAFITTFVNQRLASMLGYEVEELIGRPADEFIDAAGREATRESFDQHARVGDRVRRDVPYRRKDGTLLWTSVGASPLIGPDGRFAGSLAMLTDITDRKRDEASVRESEERYRVLFDENPMPMWAFDEETLAITAVNRAAVEHYGYSREELLSKTLRDLRHPDQESGAIATLAASAGKARSVVRRHVKKGGASITVEVFSHAVQLAGRRHLLSTIRDITDQQEMEERLRQSQKMEAVGRLAGGVAHDFNNLLTVMFGYSDVLLQGLDPGPLREAAQEIRWAGDRAAGLTRQLLAFSRKQTLVPEVLDLGEVVSGLLTMVGRLIGEDIKVGVVVSPNLGRVKADRGQMEQVVMNLAVNARDAMPKGGSLLFELQNVELDDAYTATHAEVEPGRYVLLAISDTGTGMDAETQDRIFEPFFTTKESGKGTGLGLSTVHGIVHQSGGSIGVYSEPGKGTTFKVYLPCFAGDAAAPRGASEIHPALAIGSETVLIVEDEAAIRQLTKLILERAGFTVLVAESPAEAERIAGRHPGPIHLLLTDVVMPGMKGPELAKRLTGLRPDLRVLYMSGYTDDAIVHNGILDAGTDFLQKPFTPYRLTQKIRAVLGSSGR